nr:hypothetical protein [Tanacetum cinerariifolium]
MVKAVARFLNRVNRALGTGLIEKRVGNVLQQKTETVRCFGTSIIVGETGSTVPDDGSDRRVLEKQHGVNIMTLAVQIGMALDVVREEVMGPGGAEMVVNVSNGMPWNVLQQKTVAVRCFGTSIFLGETGSTVSDDEGDCRVLEIQHSVNIMALAVQIRMALDVAGEEVVGPRGAEMVVNVSNGMPW